MRRTVIGFVRVACSVGLLVVGVAALTNPPAFGQVKSHQKISDTEGGFDGILQDTDGFGFSVASAGDIDRDGVPDLVVGAPFDDDEGFNRGAVWVLFLERNGTVKAHQKISDRVGGFDGPLGDLDLFGMSVASPGDLDEDEIPDLVVGAPRNSGAGAVWVLFLERNGTVKGQQKISGTEGGFGGFLQDGDSFGRSVASLGDFNGDGVPDLVIGAPGDDDSRGAVWVLFLERDGTVKGEQKISDTEGGFDGILQDTDSFGISVASQGDLDGDGMIDLAVGAMFDNVGRGAVWVLFLTEDGTVKAHQKISDTEGGFGGILDEDDNFGTSVANPGDLDGDEIPDLVVGAPSDDDGGSARGAAWVLFLTEDGTVKAHQKISDTEGGFGGILGEDDSFGTSVASPGDLDGDGIPDLVAGAPGDGNGRGAVWVLFGGFARHLAAPGLSTNHAGGTQQNAYRLFSLPLTLDNNRAGAVLEDDLGPPNNDAWRLFELLADQSYGEGPAGLAFTPGKAFWLITRDDISINTGAGTTVRADQPFEIDVHPGWNFVGTPFTFPVVQSQLRLQSGGPVQLQTFRGSWQPLSGALQPFEGYALRTDAADKLIIDPSNSVTTATGVGKQAALTAEASYTWAIRVRARCQQARDEHNLAAVAPAVSEGHDAMDWFEPPVIGQYVSVSFPRDAAAAAFTVDVRPEPAEGIVWPLEVRSNIDGYIELRFEDLEEVPEAFEVWLVDEALGLRQDLRARPRYIVASPGAEQARRLKLVVGRRAFIEAESAAEKEMPLQFGLLGNYPNPFSGVTTIRYALPEAQSVTVKVYDVLGKEVAVLLAGEEQAAGHHAVIWEGRDQWERPVASGLYVCRLQAGTSSAVQSMMLVR